MAESIAEESTDDLLTTGEAARLFNSSRQHVVDLCTRGDLPFASVGTHRRVRRSDVLSIQERSLRLTRDQRRSLWLAFAVAGRIAMDPEGARAKALENVEKMRSSARGQAVVWLDAWTELLSGPVEELLRVMTSKSPKGRELRQNSPCAGVLSETERAAALDAWRESDARPL